MSAALSGLRVLDLSRILAGPWATQLLADYGAEIVKVERPGGGDDTRRWGPPWLRDRRGRATADAAYFLAANRNKKSITVELGHPEGRRIIAGLAQRSDVVVENFRVGTLERYGLGFATLRARNPALICCSISAYGQDGPRRDEAGYDAIIQASGGLMSLTGEAGGPPQKAGVAVADIMAGMYAATAILAALHARRRSGVGQCIDVPLFDSQLAWLANQAMNYLVGGEVPGRHGSGHPNIVPYQALPTADGYLMLAVGNDRQFAACAACLGMPELAGDARYRTNAARVAHREALIARLTARLRSAGTAHWLEEFAAAGVPAGPINDLAQAFAEPQVAARGLLRELPHAAGGTVPTVANPVRFAATPVEYRRAPPALGADTDAVLRELLGCDAVKIAELRAAGAI